MAKTLLKLSNDNYYSKEANFEYLSVSQYKDFCGTMAKKGCEYSALAKLRGEYIPEPSKDMLMGSYIDSAYEGTLEEFKNNHPEMFLTSGKNAGQLKADFIKAQNAYDRTQRDELFKLYMSGEKQKIMTAELFGANWKIKMDSYHEDKCIVDLKYIKDIHDRTWIKDLGYFVNFIEAWGYDLQLAIYQLVVEKNTGQKLPCYIAAVDKKTTPEIELIQINQMQLDTSLIGIESNVKRILELKKGNLEPDKCGVCEYCLENKILTSPIDSSRLIEI